MAKKRRAAVVKIQIQAGQATPAPPVGTALGPHGINIMDFCKAYNAATENQRGMVIPAEISIFEDRSFRFARSPRPRCPTSTRSTSKVLWRKCPAPLVPWESRSPDDDSRQEVRRCAR